MHLKVMADYHCAPLWRIDDPAHLGDVAPERLGLSAGLCTDLWAWAARYDAILVPDDPLASAFASEADARDFEAQGAALAQRVAAELGARARIWYWRKASPLQEMRA